MSVVETSFSKDKSACAPTLLKTVSTKDILIDQVHKFQSSYFNPIQDGGVEGGGGGKKVPLPVFSL